MFDRSRIRFHNKNWQKTAQDFFFAVSKVFDRVKTVAQCPQEKKKIYIYL